MQSKNMPEKSKAYTFLAEISTPDCTTDTNPRKQQWDLISSAEAVST